MTLSWEVLQREPSNNELQEVSRSRSSVEVSVMGMEQRTEQICQLLKLSIESVYAIAGQVTRLVLLSKQERMKGRSQYTDSEEVGG